MHKKTFLIALSSFLLALFLGVLVFLQYHKEKKLSWANLGEPSISRDFPGGEFFFTERECKQTGGIMIYSDTTTSASSPYFFENSDYICGTSGTLLGQEYTDAIGYFCCKF